MESKKTIKALEALKPGEEYTLPGGKRVFCIQGLGCAECAFHGKAICDRLSCLAFYRKDAVNVGYADPDGGSFFARHRRLRAAADTARAILADIDVRADIPEYTTASIGRAFQLLDQALNADTETTKTEEAE